MPPKATSSAWSYLADFPPLKVRLIAHRPVRASQRNCIALSDAEIAIASGIALDRVRAISRMMDWDGVKLGEIKAFCAACGFDPTITAHREGFSKYEAKCLQRQSRPFQWLHRHPAYAEEILPLIRKLNRSLSPIQHVA